MLTRSSASHPSRGFTLIELVVTIALMAVLFGLAVPVFGEWIRNARVRTAADALQNGVRTAQAESLRRNRPIVFFLTNAQPVLGVNAAANGRNWSVQTIARFDDATPEFIQGGSLADVSSGVTITGPIALCFNSNGRLVSNANDTGPTGTGVTNAICNAASPPFDLTLPAYADARALRVTVGLGGQVRMCDPTPSRATSPDGCPP
jgi:type IV fimbrial biogenesis protein FimT